MPAHPVALQLIRRAGVPIAAPSANMFSRTSPTTAAHVLEDLDGRIDAILDAGPTAHGVESTVLDPGQSPMMIYRPGAITAEQIRAVAGPVETYQKDIAASEAPAGAAFPRRGDAPLCAPRPPRSHRSAALRPAGATRPNRRALRKGTHRHHAARPIWLSPGGRKQQFFPGDDGRRRKRWRIPCTRACAPSMASAARSSCARSHPVGASETPSATASARPHASTHDLAPAVLPCRLV